LEDGTRLSTARRRNKIELLRIDRFRRRTPWGGARERSDRAAAKGGKFPTSGSEVNLGTVQYQLSAAAFCPAKYAVHDNSQCDAGRRQGNARAVQDTPQNCNSREGTSGDNKKPSFTPARGLESGALRFMSAHIEQAKIAYKTIKQLSHARIYTIKTKFSIFRPKHY